jgi:hypothetical protein
LSAFPSPRLNTSASGRRILLSMGCPRLTVFFFLEVPLRLVLMMWRRSRKRIVLCMADSTFFLVILSLLRSLVLWRSDSFLLPRWSLMTISFQMSLIFFSTLSSHNTHFLQHMYFITLPFLSLFNIIKHSHFSRPLATGCLANLRWLRPDCGCCYKSNRFQRVSLRDKVFACKDITTVNANPNTDRNYVLHNQLPVWVLASKFDRPLTLTLQGHCYTLNHYNPEGEM